MGVKPLLYSTTKAAITNNHHDHHQKFVLKSAACHCRRERECKKKRVCAPVRSGETRSILQQEADRLAIAVY